jgi:hypothetical protein
MINTTMKSFKQYLTEHKKLYSFKVKVAGTLPENFQEQLGRLLEKYEVKVLTKMTTPVQESPLDFPQLINREVHIYDLALEYPITAPEVATFVRMLGVTEDVFRVRNSSEPIEYEQAIRDEILNPDGLLNDSLYGEAPQVEHKNYFGNEFNTGFLKELADTAGKIRKENKSGCRMSEYKLPEPKQDKAGMSSAIGSKK